MRALGGAFNQEKALDDVWRSLSLTPAAAGGQEAVLLLVRGSVRVTPPVVLPLAPVPAQTWWISVDIT